MFLTAVDVCADAILIFSADSLLKSWCAESARGGAYQAILERSQASCVSGMQFFRTHSALPLSVTATVSEFVCVFATSSRGEFL